MRTRLAAAVVALTAAWAVPAQAAPPFCIPLPQGATLACVGVGDTPPPTVVFGPPLVVHAPSACVGTTCTPAYTVSVLTVAGVDGCAPAAVYTVPSGWIVVCV